MKRLKQISILVVLVSLVGVGIAQPVFAADGDPTFFESFVQSVRRQVRKVYLALPGNKAGREVLRESLAVMSEVRSVRTQNTIKMIGSGNEQDLFELNAQIDTTTQATDSADPSTYQQDISADVRYTSNGVTIDGQAALKQAGTRWYVLFNDLPVLPRIPTKELTGFWLSFSDLNSEASSKTALTEQQKYQMYLVYLELIQNAEVGSAVRTTVDGGEYYAIELSIDNDFLTEAYKDMLEITGKSEAERAGAVDALGRSLVRLGGFKAKVLIDTQSYHLKEITVPMTFNLADVPTDRLSVISAQLPSRDVSGLDTLVVDLVVRLSDYDQPFLFELPSEVVPLEELTPLFLESMGLTARQPLSSGLPIVEATSQASVKKPAELKNLTAEQRSIINQITDN